jgi:hypothetical protein
VNGVEAKPKKDQQQTVEIDANGNVSPSESSRYTTCESCVDHGWGWSWSFERCGEYINQDCSEEAAAEADTNKKSSSAKKVAPDEDEEEEEDDDENGEDDEDDEEDDVEVEDDDPATDRNRLPDLATVKRRITETAGDHAWSDTERTTFLWQLVSQNDLEGLRQLIYRDPESIHLRAKDGRGPLFWAYEYNKKAIIDLLIDLGANEDAQDKEGNTPIDLRQ